MCFVFVYKHTTRVSVHFSLQHLITYMRRNAENFDSVSANREDVHFKSVFLSWRKISVPEAINQTHPVSCQTRPSDEQLVGAHVCLLRVSRDYHEASQLILRGDVYLPRPPSALITCRPIS